MVIEAAHYVANPFRGTDQASGQMPHSGKGSLTEFANQNVIVRFLIVSTSIHNAGILPLDVVVRS